MDKKRKHIGLFYTRSYDLSQALIIYIQNIIKGFNLLPDDDQPYITLLHGPTSELEDVRAIKYPYIDYYEIDFKTLPLYKRLLNKLSRIITKKNMFTNHNFKDLSFDSLYPIWWSDLSKVNVKQSFYWCIDFISLHYPQYFSAEESTTFKNNIIKAALTHNNLVFSSNDAYQDFLTLVPNYKGDVHILRFPSILNLVPKKKKIF